MGYTHYWYRPAKLNADTFKKFTADCKKIIDYSINELGIDIAGGCGEGLPLIESDVICFNGSDMQRIGQFTTTEKLSIPWPSSTASLEETSSDPIAPKISGGWFAGCLVSQRVAPINNLTGYGSGSYETFSIELEETAHDNNPLVFNCTKTAYRPYDLTITACLIAFKFHFGGKVKISTDGEEKDWLDGRILCNNLLGYGMDIDLFAEVTEKPEVIKKPEVIRERKPLKDIAAEIKQYLKFKGVQVNAGSRTAGTANSIWVTIKGGDNEVGQAGDVNQYHYKNSGFREQYTEYGIQVIDWIMEIILKYHWDESDSQSDYFHCAFYYHIDISKEYKVKEPKTSELSPITGIQIINYSEKAIAIIGETKAIKEKLKELGGKFNFRLNCGAGWIFSKRQEQAVRTALNL